MTRDPSSVVTLHGRAVRDAAPAAGNVPFPLLIVSHGYPGNRFLMSHLCENLASKGFVAVSLDHPDSTYDDLQSFASTLYNRPLDQLFALNEVARLSTNGSGSFLSGLVDANRTALIGYSMGGYGAINVIGGGFSKHSESARGAPPNRLLGERGAANPEYRRGLDVRVKAAIAIGPWGMRSGLWDADGLKGIPTPVMFVAGSADDVSGYETGTRALYEGAVNADRYLLTYVNANHNAGAPMPAPAEAYTYSETLRSFPFTHYADPVWDTTRMNNILAHFSTAFLELHLKDARDRKTYLDVVADAKDAVHSVDREGKPQADHTYWPGFKPRTAIGLKLEHATPAR
jgi:predicted dienelactone hydrolase